MGLAASPTPGWSAAGNIRRLLRRRDTEPSPTRRRRHDVSAAEGRAWHAAARDPALLPARRHARAGSTRRRRGAGRDHRDGRRRAPRPWARPIDRLSPPGLDRRRARPASGARPAPGARGGCAADVARRLRTGPPAPRDLALDGRSPSDRARATANTPETGAESVTAAGYPSVRGFPRGRGHACQAAAVPGQRADRDGACGDVGRSRDQETGRSVYVTLTVE